MRSELPWVAERVLATTPKELRHSLFSGVTLAESDLCLKFLKKLTFNASKTSVIGYI
jgi:hypothetical protein